MWKGRVECHFLCCFGWELLYILNHIENDLQNVFLTGLLSFFKYEEHILGGGSGEVGKVRTEEKVIFQCQLF